MKYTLSLCLVAVITLSMILGIPAISIASTPSLSMSSSGSSDVVQLTVYGDAYSSVYLYFQKSSYGFQSQSIGTTNSSGYLSTSLNTSYYGAILGSQAYVMINGQQSNTVTWPYNGGYNNYNTGNLSLSQTNVNLTVGQTVNISIYGGYSSYSMYPGSQNIYLAAISGNILTIVGQGIGSDNLRVCNYGGGSCATIYISVTSGSNNYYNNQVALSQGSVSLMSGGNAVVTISGNGGYYVSSHTNPSIVTASLTGNTLNLYGNSYGSDNISICQTGGQCATLYVTVTYNNNYQPVITQTPITFSQQNISLSSGQSLNISVYGGATNYYTVAYNSNTSSLQTSLNGSTLTLTSLSNNSINSVVICSVSNNCSALSVKVNGGNVLGAQNNWTYCSSENQYCSFYGTQTVRYGANGSYFYRTLTGGTSCSNAVFGDPLFGVAKQCSYGGQY